MDEGELRPCYDLLDKLVPGDLLYFYKQSGNKSSDIRLFPAFLLETGKLDDTSEVFFKTQVRFKILDHEGIRYDHITEFYVHTE